MKDKRYSTTTMTLSKFKPRLFLHYAADFYKLSTLLIRSVLLKKPVMNLEAYKTKTKQLLLDQSKPNDALPNLAAVKLLHWDREFGLLQYYGVQEYARRWWKSRSSSISPSTSIPKSDATEQGRGSTRINQNNNVGRIAFMITSEQRQKLSTDLGYTQQDIRSFKPIEALLLIEHDVKKTTADDKYNFRTRLKELNDENEKIIKLKETSSSLSYAATEKGKKSILPKKPQHTISPEEAEQAHAKADVAMALLSAEAEEIGNQKEDLPAAREVECFPDVTMKNNISVDNEVSLVDEKTQKGTHDTTKSEANGITSRTASPPLMVQVTPNDSTELHMKPDVAAALIGSHLQIEEPRCGRGDESEEEVEDEGPCWYEVIMSTIDVETDNIGEQQESSVVVALFATKKEAFECVSIKEKLGSRKDKKFSVRRRWNV